MLKMYQSGLHKGGEPELWEANWEKSNFESTLRFCSVDPLAPLFIRYARPGTNMLEGGCGVGQYVAYYSARGVNVIGLDFARDALASLRTRAPGLKLCAGDVAALPFRDQIFDLYYSGGVVEHFEEGPERAILEARRVLRPEGVLLISVPYLSILRRVMLRLKSKSWRRVSKASIDSENGDLRFFQYVYSVREFDEILYKSGFRVIARQGYGILWGLYDIGILEKLIARLTGGSVTSDALSSQVATSVSSIDSSRIEEVSSASSRSDSHEYSARAIIKRLVVSEDDTVPLAGAGVRLMRRVCANMMMYVCQRSNGNPT